MIRISVAIQIYWHRNCDKKWQLVTNHLRFSIAHIVYLLCISGCDEVYVHMNLDIWSFVNTAIWRALERTKTFPILYSLRSIRFSSNPHPIVWIIIWLYGRIRCDITIQSSFRIYPDKMFVVWPVFCWCACACIHKTFILRTLNEGNFPVIIVISLIILSFSLSLIKFLCNAERCRNWNAVLSC